ncbi:FAD-dependent oxidoreductase [Parafrigoribacterium soli]|uniref:FAD-dependent oxidoreductase n=1 Tax=Parafrigoribacterium soli TaxID=3144663 RepID=UPI0032EBD1D6
MTARMLRAQCCIAGGGPAGLMLGFLLARAGVKVVVLEKHADFLRDFRGDTIHPSTIDLLDQLGLKERFLELPHDDIETLDIVVSGNRIRPVDFSRLHKGTRFLALMPQWDFLYFISTEAAKHPNFTLLMSTEVTGLLREGERIVGVTATDVDGPLEIRADLTVAADGRSSVVREASGLVAEDFGVGIDVLWFTLPKPQNSPPATLGYIDRHSMVITIPRGDHFQAGLIIPKGGFDEIRQGGLDAFRQRLVDTAAFLEPVVPTIADWDQVKLLSVQVNRLDRWYQPSFLCIGDAAHAMSPAFGVGVNYAIQDAVAAANYLTVPLLGGRVSERELARVQRRRLWPVKRIQPIQLLLHKTIARPGSGVALPTPLPRRTRLLLKIALPIVQRLAARLVGRGFRPERVSRELQRLSAH